MKLAKAGMSPEAHFVSLCVREPDALAGEGMLSAAAAVRDWDEVATLAIRHRVAAYVLRASRRVAVTLPEAARERVEQDAFASQAQAMFLDAQLRRVLAALANVGLTVMVLKGPALARTLYPEPGLRPYADLDINVQDHDASRAVQVLLQLGFSEIRYESEYARQAHIGHAHESGSFHRQFGDPTGRCLIELHRDPLQLGLNPVCETGRWQRAKPIPDLPAGLMLAPEDQVVQLSVHAHKHGYSRLIWLKDLDLLLRRSGAMLDWSVVEDVARREGVQSSVWYTLTLAEAMLGTPVPSSARRLAPRALSRALYRTIWPTRRVVNLQGFLRRRAVQFHAAESWHGMLPSVLLMGRRAVRVQLIMQALLHNR